MAYKALYRAFRPRRFADVCGQEHITNVLKRQVTAGSVSHAYLFSGPRGTGKTSVAKILACAVNCLSPEEGEPCGKCEVCVSALSESFIDIIEMDAASNNGVDNIRDIKEKVSLLPASGKYKVYIIDEVHMLSPGAFNALLKTLEEPPSHAVFILATTELRKLPKTIISRCQQFDFHRIGERDIVSRLEFVAKESGIDCEDGALEIIARAAEGAMRDALSIMDMCIAGGSGVTIDGVNAAVGMAGQQSIAALCDFMLDEKAAEGISLLEEMQKGGAEPEGIMRDMITALSVRLSREKETNAMRKILRRLTVLIEAQGTLRFSPVQRAVLEAAYVRGALPAADTGAGESERILSLEKRMEALEKRDAGGAAATNNGASVQKSAAQESEIRQKSDSRMEAAAQLKIGGEEIKNTREGEEEANDFLANFNDNFFAGKIVEKD